MNSGQSIGFTVRQMVSHLRSTAIYLQSTITLINIYFGGMEQKNLAINLPISPIYPISQNTSKTMIFFGLREIPQLRTCLSSLLSKPITITKTDCLPGGETSPVSVKCPLPKLFPVYLLSNSSPAPQKPTEPNNQTCRTDP